MGKKRIFLLSLIILILLSGGLLAAKRLAYHLDRPSAKSQQRVLGEYKNPPQKPADVTLVFVGDSMTEHLGNFDELKAYLKDYNQSKSFGLLNYGFGSTSILSVKDRLDKESTYSGRLYQAINDIPFDLVFIESFGHNPLSQYPLQEGLKKQTETLDQIVASITQKHPKSSIVFIATIAPNRDKYGAGAVALLPEQREKWVNERIAYIKNHIFYANAHQIPLINIYEKSLDWFGTGNLDYVNSADYIHPSPIGVYMISKEIAKFISAKYQH